MAFDVLCHVLKLVLPALHPLNALPPFTVPHLTCPANAAAGEVSAFGALAARACGAAHPAPRTQRRAHAPGAEACNRVHVHAAWQEHGDNLLEVS